MAEQRLSMHGHQIELAGRKGDMAALGERVRARVGHGLALVQLDAGQVRTKGLLHFGLDRGGQIHPARALLNRGQAGHRLQGVLLRDRAHGAGRRLGGVRFSLVSLHGVTFLLA